MGRIYQRGHTWWIQYYRQGQLFRETSRSPLKSVATTLLKKREGEIAQGRIPALRAEKTTFEELAALYLQDYAIAGRKTTKRAKEFIAHLTKDFTRLRTVEMTTSRILDYIERRQQEGAANGTINRELAALKRMFRLGLQQTPPLVVGLPHIPHLQEDNIRTGFFTDEEYKLLRAALPDHLKVPFIVAYWTGMRTGEIVQLRWDQVNPDEGWIRLEPAMTKTRKGRVVPLLQEVRQVLLHWRRVTLMRYPTCPWVCHFRGRRLERLPHRTWLRICAEVGLPGKLFHDLRRTAVRNMVRAGIPERVAMEISGHKTRSVFDRYDIVNEADLLDAMRHLESKAHPEIDQGADEFVGWNEVEWAVDEHTFEHNGEIRGEGDRVSG